MFADGDYEKAAEFYREALRNDSSCTEALYNIGKRALGVRSAAHPVLQSRLSDCAGWRLAALMVQSCAPGGGRGSRPPASGALPVSPHWGDRLAHSPGSRWC